MSKQREFKKYRKNALKEIHYQNVYEDGVIETKQGYFTKMYRCFGDVLMLFDFLYNFYNQTNETVFAEFGLNKINAQITYFDGSFYFTVGLAKNSYEECSDIFSIIDSRATMLNPLSFRERMEVLHAMYQNDDQFDTRYNNCVCRKGEVNPPSEFASVMKNLRKNKKISKDLILPVEMKNGANEFEFEGNYIRFFYFKNTPRYITNEFLDDLKKIENVCFSIHLKPLNQTEIVEYVEKKYENKKELKETELIQKHFFDIAEPELKKSAKRNEKMFLITLVLGVANDSIDELDIKMKQLTRELETTYVVKALKFQQKNALHTFLPFCEDNLDIKTTMYKQGE